MDISCWGVFRLWVCTPIEGGDKHIIWTGPIETPADRGYGRAGWTWQEKPPRCVTGATEVADDGSLYDVAPRSRIERMAALRPEQIADFAAVAGAWPQLLASAGFAPCKENQSPNTTL